jgi:hypothetical protein
MLNSPYPLLYCSCHSSARHAVAMSIPIPRWLARAALVLGSYANRFLFSIVPPTTSSGRTILLIQLPRVCEATSKRCFPGHQSVEDPRQIQELIQKGLKELQMLKVRTTVWKLSCGLRKGRRRTKIFQQASNCRQSILPTRSSGCRRWPLGMCRQEILSTLITSSANHSRASNEGAKVILYGRRTQGK